jgi:hypothetical protein
VTKVKELKTNLNAENAEKKDKKHLATDTHGFRD